MLPSIELEVSCLVWKVLLLPVMVCHCVCVCLFVLVSRPACVYMYMCVCLCPLPISSLSPLIQCLLYLPSFYPPSPSLSLRSHNSHLNVSSSVIYSTTLISPLLPSVHRCKLLDWEWAAIRENLISFHKALSWLNEPINCLTTEQSVGHVVHKPFSRYQLMYVHWSTCTTV